MKLQAFLGITSYLGEFSPSTADIWESPRKLMSAQAEWTLNATYQNMFDKAKGIIKKMPGLNSMMKLNNYT